MAKVFAITVIENKMFLTIWPTMKAYEAVHPWIDHGFYSVMMNNEHWGADKYKDDDNIAELISLALHSPSFDQLAKLTEFKFYNLALNNKSLPDFMVIPEQISESDLQNPAFLDRSARINAIEAAKINPRSDMPTIQSVCRTNTQELLWDAYMALDNGTYDETQSVLERLETYFIQVGKPANR